MSKLTALFRLTFIVLLAGAGLVLIPACDAELGANSAWDKGLAAYEIRDYVTALRELQPLAEQGNADAQNYLGFMYYKGKGVPQDDKAAVQWYRRAAEQGDADAQKNLGVMSRAARFNLGFKAAAQQLRRAAEQGIAFAQGKLGWMYAQGKGVPIDYVYAHMWANIAASVGNNINAAALLNRIEIKMTLSQITEAQKLARECILKAYKNCD